MLVSIDLDDSNEDEIVAVYDVAGALIRIKSKPAVARGRGEEEEREGGDDDDEATAAAAAEGAGGGRAPPYQQAKYANVGLVLWQAGLVAADWIIRYRATQAESPEASKKARLRGVSVVELGCGVGQCGVALAAAGASPVVMTDLPHIVPLARENARLNAGATPVAPLAVPYVWGEDAAPVLDALRGGLPGPVKEKGGGEEEGEGGGRWPDLLVAADCLYEPSVYPLLLAAIGALSGPDTRAVLCHRMRVYGEEGFERAAEGAGYEVRVAPREELHAEYACGGWRLVELTRRPRRGDDGGGGGDHGGGGV